MKFDVDELITKAHDEAKALLRRGEYLYTLAMIAKRGDVEGQQAREELERIYGSDHVQLRLL